MTEIEWADGLVHAPSGDEMRQLPEAHCWSSGVFIARNGLCWRRFYNSITRLWAWADAPLDATIEENGRWGYNVGWWRPIELCIALAWLHRAEGSTLGVRVKVTVELVESVAPQSAPASPTSAERGPHADDLEFAEVELDDGEPIAGETWRKLKWRVGLVPCDARYKISNHGRLWSPFTQKMTRGFWAYDTRWAATRDGLLVNLYAAAGLVPMSIPPSIRMALDSLLSAELVAPETLAGELDVAETTAWNYVCRAAAFAPPHDLLVRARALTHPAMWDALLLLGGDGRLGGSLTELFEVLQEMLPPRSMALRSKHAMSELRLARMALVNAVK